MLKDLVKLANHMDKIGLRKEADYLDHIIKNANISNTWVKRTWGRPRNALATAEGKKAYESLNAFNSVFSDNARMLYQSLKLIDVSLKGLDTDVRMEDRKESPEERAKRVSDKRDAKGRPIKTKMEAMPGHGALKEVGEKVNESAVGELVNSIPGRVAKLLGRTTEQMIETQEGKVLTEAFASMGPRLPTWFKVLAWGSNWWGSDGRSLDINSVKDIESARKGLKNAEVIMSQIYKTFPEDASAIRGKHSSSDIRVAALAVNTAAKQALAALNAWTATAKTTAAEPAASVVGP